MELGRASQQCRVKGTEPQDTGDLEEGVPLELRTGPWLGAPGHSLFHRAEPQAESWSAAGSGLEGEAFPQTSPTLTPALVVHRRRGCSAAAFLGASAGPGGHEGAAQGRQESAQQAAQGLAALQWALQALPGLWHRQGLWPKGPDSGWCHLDGARTGPAGGAGRGGHHQDWHWQQGRVGTETTQVLFTRKQICECCGQESRERDGSKGTLPWQLTSLASDQGPGLELCSVQWPQAASWHMEGLGGFLTINVFCHNEWGKVELYLQETGVGLPAKLRLVLDTLDAEGKFLPCQWIQA